MPVPHLLVRFAVFAAACVLSFAAPAHAAPPVEAYGRLPAVEQVTLSPSGQRYAFIAVVGEARKLVAAGADGKSVLFSGDLGQAKVVGIEWAGEDRLVVTISHSRSLSIDYSIAKAEIQTVLVINLATGSMFNVFKDLPGVAPLVYGRYGSAWVGGKWFGFFGGETYDPLLHGGYYNSHRIDLYRIDLDTGGGRVVARGAPHIAGWLVGPDGAVIARTRHDEVKGDWQVLSGSVGGHVIAQGSSRLSGVAVARGSTPGSVLIILPADQNRALREVALAGDAPPLVDPQLDTDTPLFDPVSGLWIGYVARGDDQAAHFFDPAAEARVKGARGGFPGLVSALISYTPDLGRMIVRTSGTGESGAFWLVDIASGAANEIGLAYPLVRPVDVGPIEMVDWTTSDGLVLHGVLNLPPGRTAKALPVVVMPHGGPEDRDYPVFNWWAQLFVANGYAVFQPNYRGSAGYGAALRDAGLGAKGGAMQSDITDGLADLARRGLVDPARACIVGWSFGGYLAQAAVTLRPGPWRCAVSMAGLSDLSRFLDYMRTADGADSDDYRYWKVVIGADSPRDPRLTAISPARRAARATAPILLIHGKDDSIVPIDESQDMARALKAAGKPVEFVTLPNADHWLLHEDTRLAMAKASLAFVLKYNPPDPDPTASPAP